MARKKSVLLASANIELIKELKQSLSPDSYKLDCVGNGKDAQLRIKEEPFEMVLLDMDIQRNNFAEVLRFIKQNKPSLKVVLVVNSSNEFKEYFPDQAEVKKLGIKDVLIAPFKTEDVVNVINNYFQTELWKTLKITNPNAEIKELNVTEKDDAFLSVPSKEFYSSNSTCFDLFIKLMPNKYIKILSLGDNFEKERLNKYIEEKKVELFYYKKEDNKIYLNMLNTVAEKITDVHLGKKFTVSSKVEITRRASFQFIDELYLNGIHPDVLEEGSTLCNNMYAMTRTRNKKLHELLDGYIQNMPKEKVHVFLCAMFSTITCQGLSWAGEKISKDIVLGAFFHDIGKLSLPEALQNESELTLKADPERKDEFEAYKEHCNLGAKALEGITQVPSFVEYVVEQHHELINGTGYPRGLTASKIYPMAKIISFTNYFTDLILTNQFSPIQGVRAFLGDSKTLEKYDPEIVKAFISNIKK